MRDNCAYFCMFLSCILWCICVTLTLIESHLDIPNKKHKQCKVQMVLYCKSVSARLLKVYVVDVQSYSQGDHV